MFGGGGSLVRGAVYGGIKEGKEAAKKFDEKMAKQQEERFNRKTVNAMDLQQPSTNLNQPRVSHM